MARPVTMMLSSTIAMLPTIEPNECAEKTGRGAGEKGATVGDSVGSSYGFRDMSYENLSSDKRRSSQLQGCNRYESPRQEKNRGSGKGGVLMVSCP